MTTFVQQDRENMKRSKTMGKELELQKKNYKRSLNRIFMAQYIQDNMAREYCDTFITTEKFDPFNKNLVYWHVCEVLELKKGKANAFVKNVKSKLVSSKFGS